MCAAAMSPSLTSARTMAYRGSHRQRGSRIPSSSPPHREGATNRRPRMATNAPTSARLTAADQGGSAVGRPRISGCRDIVCTARWLGRLRAVGGPETATERRMDRMLGTITTFLAAIMITSVIMFDMPPADRTRRGAAAGPGPGAERGVQRPGQHRGGAGRHAATPEQGQGRDQHGAGLTRSDLAAHPTCVYAVRLSAHLFTAWQWSGDVAGAGQHSLAARACALVPTPPRCGPGAPT